MRQLTVNKCFPQSLTERKDVYRIYGIDRFYPCFFFLPATVIFIEKCGEAIRPFALNKFIYFTSWIDTRAKICILDL